MAEQSTVRSPEVSARWVRGFVGETAVVDSRAQLIGWEAELPVPRYLFRRQDVVVTALRPTAAPETLSYHKPI